jgi:hypothetical protein
MKGASSVKLRLIAQKLFAILTEAHDTYQEVVADCSGGVPRPRAGGCFETRAKHYASQLTTGDSGAGAGAERPGLLAVGRNVFRDVPRAVGCCEGECPFEF